MVHTSVLVYGKTPNHMINIFINLTCLVILQTLKDKKAITAAIILYIYFPKVQCHFCEECNFNAFAKCAEADYHQSFHCESPRNSSRQVLPHLISL